MGKNLKGEIAMEGNEVMTPAAQCFLQTGGTGDTIQISFETKTHNDDEYLEAGKTQEACHVYLSFICTHFQCRQASKVVKLLQRMTHFSWFLSWVLLSERGEEKCA